MRMDLAALLTMLVGLVDGRVAACQDPIPPYELPGQLPVPLVPPEPKQQEAERARPIGSSEVRMAEPVSEVNVSEFMTVDIFVQNDYVTSVLHKLAIQSRRNIVPSNNVERLVNATIFGVPFYDALSGLLEPNGLGYVERGEFIYVYTVEELAAFGEGGYGPITRIVYLDYVRSIDAREYALPMLSDSGYIGYTRDVSGEEEGGSAADAAAMGAAMAGNAQGSSSGDGTEEVYTPDLDKYDLRNAVVIQDYPENVARIEAFLAELDTPPVQVLLEATIVQTGLTEANALGVDFAMLSGEDFLDFFQVPTVDVTPPGATGSEGQPIGFENTPTSSGAFGMSGAGNTGLGDATFRAGYVGDVGVFLRALDRVTDVTLLSNPKVLTLNRQRSRVLVGERVGYTERTVIQDQVLENIKFLDTGIVLDIRPYVLQDGRIRLELSSKVSGVEFRGEIPDEQIQTVTTDVLVPGGYTAVLGGLFKEDTTRGRSQVPFLGDIPLVGTLFRGRDDTINEVEIIFLIKPTVMNDQTLIEQGRRGEEYDRRVRVGSRLGLLPWSRERHSARLNLEAERLLAEGQTDKARWKIRRSLEVRPSQPEIIRLHEVLGGDPLWWSTDSYLDRIIAEEHALPAAEKPRDEQGGGE